MIYMHTLFIMHNISKKVLESLEKMKFTQLSKQLLLEAYDTV